MERKAPAAVVDAHNIKIPIHRRNDHQHGVSYEAFYFVQTVNGKRRQRRFNSLHEAKKQAKELILTITKRPKDSHILSEREFSDYSAALQILQNHSGVTLASAVAEWSEAKNLLEGGSIVGACEQQKTVIERNEGFHQAKVKDVYESFIKQLQDNDGSSRYLEDCRSRMGRIAEQFSGLIHNVHSKDLADWMNNLKVSPRTRRNFRTAAVTLWKFAKERGHLPRNLETEAELIPAIGRLKSGKKEAEIGIYTPSEFHKILTAAQKHLLAPIAIGGFAGLRSAEVHRLLWGEVHDSHIVVKAGNAKTGSRRIVPVLPSLKAWLAKVERGDPTERVCARFSHENGLARAQTVAIKSAGVVPVHNGLRHSFCTYRLADIQDAAKVALEAGNSPQMLFKHYRALATATTATEWFAIGMPASRSRGRPRSRKAKQKKKSAA